MPKTKDLIWKTIFWTADVLFRITLLKMQSVHLQLAVRIGCFQTLRKEHLHLLQYMPDTDWRNHPEDLDDLMPWSETVKAECKG